MKAIVRRAPEKRRGDLVAAAKKAFAKKGVAATTVSDIVKAANVAQGTFYLYFKTKEDVINALAEQMAESMVASVEEAIDRKDASAVDKLLALRDAILDMAGDSMSKELATVYHRPNNKAFHDRMAEQLTPRLARLVEQIVRQGIEERTFTVEDPRVAAWFVLGGLHALEVGFTNPEELPSAVSCATTCALRALGHDGSRTATAREERR